MKARFRYLSCILLAATLTTTLSNQAFSAVVPRKFKQGQNVAEAKKAKRWAGTRGFLAKHRTRVWVSLGLGAGAASSVAATTDGTVRTGATLAGIVSAVGAIKVARTKLRERKQRNLARPNKIRVPKEPHYFTVEKASREEGPNEDAVAFDGENGVYALSDGVGTSSMPSAFSRGLAEAFRDYPTEDRDRLTTSATALWREEVTTLPATGIFGVAKRDGEGAAATLLGVVRGAKQGRARLWKVHALAERVGIGEQFSDSVAFRITERGEILDQYPPIVSFDAHTALLATRGSATEARRPAHIATKTMETRAGDVILMATDAVAEAIVKSMDSKTRVSPIAVRLIEAQADGRFQQEVQSARASGEMKDDDASVIVVPHE